VIGDIEDIGRSPQNDEREKIDGRIVLQLKKGTVLFFAFFLRSFDWPDHSFYP
jgi:hypothetical protein